MILLPITAGTFGTIARAGATHGTDPVYTVGVGHLPAGNSGVWETMGDIPKIGLEPRYKDLTPRIKHLPQGGSWEEKRRRLIGADIKFPSYDISEPFVRMAFGVKTEIEDGTPAAPLRNQDAYLECWFNWQNRADDATDVTITALYGRLRIDTNPTWGDITPTEPAWIFEVHPSSIASLETLGLLPAD
jgi:hypothetical protein